MQTTLMAYQTRINEALTLGRLVDVLHGMDPTLVAETIELVKTMDDKTFKDWRIGWVMLQEDTDPGQDWYDQFLDLIIPPPIARMELFLTEGEDVTL